MSWVATALACPLMLVLLLGVGLQSAEDDAASAAIDALALPPLAAQLLTEVEELRSRLCPDLPLVWVLAQVQAESSWDPLAYSSAGAAGLLQFRPGTWQEAGGEAWPPEQRPAVDHAVWSPLEHLETALPWMCANLRGVAQHLSGAGKPTEPLDALAVCHIAGCFRVLRSATGVPTAGEAGCDAICAAEVQAYLETIHGWVLRFSSPVSAADGAAAAPVPWSGGGGGCTVPDPTGTGGCVTPATAWLLQQTATGFADLPVSCWDAHAWNPGSDHPRGRACDYTIGRLGDFPAGADLDRGWQLAEWLRQHADALAVTYVIWQGRIWSAGRAEQGWRPYTGGGVYDPTDATGGHYDHVHVSVAG